MGCPLFCNTLAALAEGWRDGGPLFCDVPAARAERRARGLPQWGAMALLVLATWLLMWFHGGGLLSAHYTHFRLRLRSQLGLLLLRRRTWLAVTAVIAVDSFCVSLNTSYVYQLPHVRLRAALRPARLHSVCGGVLLRLREARACACSKL